MNSSVERLEDLLGKNYACPLQMAVTWARLKQLQELAITVVGKGESTNPNGLVVDVMGISGFLPKRFMDRVSLQAFPRQWSQSESTAHWSNGTL